MPRYEVFIPNGYDNAFLRFVKETPGAEIIRSRPTPAELTVSEEEQQILNQLPAKINRMRDIATGSDDALWQTMATNKSSYRAFFGKLIDHFALKKVVVENIPPDIIPVFSGILGELFQAYQFETPLLRARKKWVISDYKPETIHPLSVDVLIDLFGLTGDPPQTATSMWNSKNLTQSRVQFLMVNGFRILTLYHKDEVTHMLQQIGYSSR